MLDIINLRQNYIDLNYSTTEVDIQIHKLISYPVYLSLMVIISAAIMFNTRKFKSSTLKISFGLFLSVVIYYLNNFFHVLGNTEKISYIASVWVPILILTFINAITIFKINEK
jgi:lipopolysaccharide export system permease protein